MVSIVFEVSVITAPALAAAIVALASPAAAVLTGAAVAAGGALAFSATGSSRGWRGEPHDVAGSGRSPPPACGRCSSRSARSGPPSASSRCSCPRSRTSAARQRRAASTSRCCRLLVMCGLVLAPATVVASTLLDTAAPPGTMTEAFAVMVMGIVAGTAIGNALGGAIVEHWSYEAGALTAGAVAALGAATALARRRTLTPPARA